MEKLVKPVATLRATPRVWIRALRLHQYAKNVLIFVPAVAGHALTVDVLTNALLAFVAFSLAASGSYLMNDVIDVADDRGHPTKRLRPIASGALSIRMALCVVPFLLIASALIAAMLPPLFAITLAGYLVLTTTYSFWLKRKMLVDVIVLAMLYIARVFAGGAATGIPISDWLLAFCLFAFTALALMKRYTELLLRVEHQLPDSTNRDYTKADLPIIAALAAATGVNTVTVLALYVRSPEVAPFYQRPQLLWLLCPLLLFLVSRALLIAHRRLMHDDPVVWALKDPVCRLAVVAGGIIVAAATYL